MVIMYNIFITNCYLLLSSSIVQFCIPIVLIHLSINQLGELVCLKSLHPNSDSIGLFLEDQAKISNVVNYSQIVSHFDLPPLDGKWKSHPLSIIFEAIDQEDSAANRPFRTSVVVCAGSGIPGQGFYEALERLKNIQDPRTLHARESLWIAELNATHAYFGLH